MANIIQTRISARGAIVSTSWVTFALAAVLSCSGCVSMGPNYDPAAVSSIQPGTSEAEVIASLGKPTSITTLGDGTRQLMWVHSKGTALGSASARSAMLLFDQSGKFVKVMSMNETNIR